MRCEIQFLVVYCSLLPEHPHKLYCSGHANTRVSLCWTCDCHPESCLAVGWEVDAPKVLAVHEDGLGLACFTSQSPCYVYITYVVICHCIPPSPTVNVSTPCRKVRHLLCWHPLMGTLTWCMSWLNSMAVS